MHLAKGLETPDTDYWSVFYDRVYDIFGEYEALQLCSLIVQNCKDYSPDSISFKNGKVEILRSNISELFTWDATPQGQTFWEFVYDLGYDTYVDDEYILNIIEQENPPRFKVEDWTSKRRKML